jgi:hypothetical protein
MILLSLFLLLQQDVQDACAGFPSNDTARALYHHWCDRVAYLEAGGPLWEHRQRDYQRELGYARNRRWYWDKVTDVLNTNSALTTRQGALNDLRERGLVK